eukprot:324263-Hanusia_phi.AAC.1
MWTEPVAADVSISISLCAGRPVLVVRGLPNHQILEPARDLDGLNLSHLVVAVAPAPAPPASATSTSL